MERVFQIVPAGSSIIATTPYRVVIMDLKKIMALAMLALMVIPSLTMAVRAEEPDDVVGLACAIERAQTYLDKVRDAAIATAESYPPDSDMKGYLDELLDLLGQGGENGPEILFLQKGEFGTAKMRYDEAHGNYVFLSDGGVGLLDDEYKLRELFGMGRVVITGVDTLLDEIATLSYDFYYTFPDSIIHPDFQAFPYMVLECDRDSDDVADLWIVLISTQIEHDAHTTGEMPPLKTWTTWTLEDYDNWHDAGAGADVSEPTDGAPLSDMKEAYPLAKVLNVKVAVGEWANGDYEAITGCVDNIEINGDIYDFEEEPEVLGAEGLLAQASAYYDAGDFKSAARCLASARNILGRINGLLRSMAKAHKVARAEKFERKFERRIQGIKDKIERQKGPKK